MDRRLDRIVELWSELPGEGIESAEEWKLDRKPQRFRFVLEQVALRVVAQTSAGDGA